MKITYDTESCHRCAGTGHHSYCSLYGTTCFECKGSGKKMTREARKSAKRIDDFLKRFSKCASQIQPGEKIRYDHKWRIVQSVAKNGGFTVNNLTGERRENITIGLKGSALVAPENTLYPVFPGENEYLSFIKKLPAVHISQ